MNKKLIGFVILPILLLAGFFVFSRQVSAFDSTLPAECNYVYNPRDNLTQDEVFWYDGKYFRFSFTSTKTFCTSWKWPYYTIFINLISSPLTIDGQTSTDDPRFSFINGVHDLDGMAQGESRFFKWEQGKRYDAYLSGRSTDTRGYLYYWHILYHYLDIGWTPEDFTQKLKIFTYNFDVRSYTRRNLKEFRIDFNYSPPIERPDPVILIPGILGSWEVNGSWELDPIFNTYDNLWEALKLAGYEVNKTLFALPYDWHLSNASTAVNLKQKIDEVKAICQCDQVDVVVHSMGGLVARSYAESDAYENDIDQLIFLATPHKGSPKNYLTWEAGSLGSEPLDKIKEKIFQLEALEHGYLSVFSYVREAPIESVRELLPIYDYLRDKETGVLRIYPNKYPVNYFLEVLNQSSNLAKLNNIRISNIVADAGENSTINAFRVVPSPNNQWEHGYPENYSVANSDHGFEFGAGDNTVPKQSNYNFFDSNDILINSNHHKVVTDSQKIVIKELIGKEPEIEVRKNYFTNFLLVRIFSPADFQIVAPDGKILGKDFSANQAINQIEGAFYSGFDSNVEFAVIPNPLEGEYKVSLEGTGNGNYRLSASYIDDSKAVDSDFSGSVAIGEVKNFDFSYQANQDQPVSQLLPDIATIDGLIKAIEEMRQDNWINNNGAQNSLVNRLKSFDKNLQKSNKKISARQELIDKNLNFLLTDVEKIKEQGKINQIGYDIIIKAINNLRNNL